MLDWFDQLSFEQRTWDGLESCVFRRSKEQWGALGNMAGGYPVRGFTSSEALYQAERYPDHPLIQKEIREAQNGFEAKLVAKKYLDLTRSDWMESARYTAMMYALTQKLFAHKAIQQLVLETDGRNIVEYSKKDRMWGANPFATFPGEAAYPPPALFGMNILGQMWKLIYRGYRQFDPPSKTSLDQFMENGEDRA